MGLSHTVRKIFHPDGFHSTLAGLKRAAYPLRCRPFIDAVDAKGFEQIRSRYGRPGDNVSPAKYLNLEEWIRTNVKRVRDLRIKAAPPRLRILDLGSGAGYFLHIAKCLGHDTLGLDASEEPIFEELFALLGLERVFRPVIAFLPLPDLGDPFDLVTAHMTCFNRHEDGSHWGPGEWAFFLDDLESHLAPSGRLHLDLNVLPDGRHMEAEVRDFFLSRGARIDRRKVYFPPGTGSHGEAMSRGRALRCRNT